MAASMADQKEQVEGAALRLPFAFPYREIESPCSPQEPLWWPIRVDTTNLIVTKRLSGVFMGTGTLYHDDKTPRYLPIRRLGSS